MKWATALTTIPKRRQDLLPQALRSLQDAGFTIDRLFVDGDNTPQSWEKEFGTPATCRYPRILTYGSWVLALAETFIRNPTADLFAIFQDDLLMARNVRQYLETFTYPTKGYWNLYTVRDNQLRAPKSKHGGTVDGWYPSNQRGLGAVALVFSRQGVIDLLTHIKMVERPLDSKWGWRKVDGGIVNSLRTAGYTEYVHSPSLVQHVGKVSCMDKRRNADSKAENFPVYNWSVGATSFRGTDWDAMSLLEVKQ